ncbi:MULTISPECIES: hypothetical protein [unclassified Coleofasciculus]|uniref:hypothetical protein n=1 Tax=unclassified Coleofasciculus TaxID=2692782 RepID=UPI0019F8356F|nr:MULTISPECIES: hypothetical protein [unclassified Coleofasciculus]MBE9149875.1 hypothetical protein [Coleofasciculus sp. LEGE 07092]
MNPRTYQLNVLIFLKDFNGQHQNLLNQLPGLFSWLATRLCFSSGSRIQTTGKKLNEGKQLPSYKNIRQHFSLAEFIVSLNLSFTKKIGQIALPGLYSNHGGDVFSPLAN